eukprot:7973267-Pyramimonas_sp.AAC.1
MYRRFQVDVPLLTPVPPVVAPQVLSDRGIRSRSVRGAYPDVLLARWMFLCILGRLPLDVLCVLAGGGFRVLEGCHSVP